MVCKLNENEPNIESELDIVNDDNHLVILYNKLGQYFEWSDCMTVIKCDSCGLDFWIQESWKEKKEKEEKVNVICTKCLGWDKERDEHYKRENNKKGFMFKLTELINKMMKKELN